MKIEGRELFEQLQPPAGGLERLQQKLTDRSLASPGRRWQPAMAVALLLTAVPFSMHWWSQPTEPAPAVAEDLFNASQFDRLLGRAPTEQALLVMRGDQTLSTIELEGAKAHIRIYRLNPNG